LTLIGVVPDKGTTPDAVRSVPSHVRRLANSSAGQRLQRNCNKLRGYRAVAIRFDKRDYIFRGTVDVASIGIWLRNPVN
jgi:hypothetical protein